MYNVYRGGICPCRHSRRQCKIFASGVNFSIFTHFLCFFWLKLLKLGEFGGVKFLAWKFGGVKFLTNSMSSWAWGSAGSWPAKFWASVLILSKKFLSKKYFLSLGKTFWAKIFLEPKQKFCRYEYRYQIALKRFYFGPDLIEQRMLWRTGCDMYSIWHNVYKSSIWLVAARQLQFSFYQLQTYVHSGGHSTLLK